MWLYRSIIALFMAGLLLSGCDDAAGPGEVAVLEAIGLTQYRVTVASTLPDPLTVRALDGSGTPLEGIEVSWTTTGGQLSQSAGVTDADGRTSVSYTVSEEAGQDTITASVEGGPEPVSYGIVAVAGLLHAVIAEPDTLTFSTPGDTARIEARAQDQYGNVIHMLAPLFFSFDTDVATVNDSGRVQAAGTGQTGILVAASGKADTVAVIVQ